MRDPEPSQDTLFFHSSIILVHIVSSGCDHLSAQFFSLLAAQKPSISAKPALHGDARIAQVVCVLLKQMQ